MSPQRSCGDTCKFWRWKWIVEDIVRESVKKRGGINGTEEIDLVNPTPFCGINHRIGLVYPADTWCNDNVIIMSKRRFDQPDLVQLDVFLEDLPDYLDLKCGVSMNTIVITYLLHADDLILISETPEGLQRLIDGLHEFCKQWHMIVNLMKTNVCVFNRKASKLARQPKLFYNGQDVDVDVDVDYCIKYKYMYLGIFFSNTKKKTCSKQPVNT